MNIIQHENTLHIQERLTARTVLLNEKNQIFLLQFKMPRETFWLTPGGKIEDNETPLLAAQRELFEETGIANARYITPHSYYSESIGSPRGTPIFFREHIFLAYTKSELASSAHLSEEERTIIVAAKWWDLDEFLNSGESFYPYALLTALTDVVYKQQLPQQTVIIKSQE